MRSDLNHSRLSRRLFLASLAACTSSVAIAQTQVAPTGAKRVVVPIPSLSQIMAKYAVSGDQSIVVMDVATGRVLEQVNAGKSLPPASVTKIATTLYGLRNLGSDFHYVTRLVGSGKVVNGVLQGDLTLMGGGDPLLDTDALGAMAERLVAKGIRTVAGKFQVHSTALPYQRVIDTDQLEHVGYNASVSGLNLNFNRVFFEWKRNGAGHETSLTAKGRKYAPRVSGIKLNTAARKFPVYAYRSVNGADHWTVASGALGSGGNRWLPVRAPANYAGETFRAIAQELGVTLPHPTTARANPRGVVLAQYNSDSLATITRDMLKFSNNLTAEVVGLTASKRRKVSGKSLAASGKEMSSWLAKTYKVKGAKFVDHSGLGDGSRISARDMGLLLRRDGWNGPLRGLLKTVGLRDANWKAAPIAGVSVVAKTGTLNFTSALAGYVECPNGRQLAFAIFTADQRKRAAIAKDQTDRAPGAKSWARGSRILQHQLIARWAKVYGA
ncbi:D-alanyl-D-alanine carboxypeptidase/D-alanyl-D-alanine-endopeptidase [Amylibacter kogurei]|uniref:D-alanyl-D-alanine carboxypeptidase/D-alanyl-D-alanine-endopeptidase n=1 Tax=Paramylibacter kogurei TaxID=1889778 RepID=A0A2G5K7P4_9RHOB|nr:D-alanyl-D-alanine carboxypeptidase/D-alanyl-D-alanine-endopeptidase [Amylibacter kogurei]PIB25042.1 D-alanyl-D-alanine carboxypeptidase/D-alanyl-D-alanine-endopeptidase [Amylibacter kogurei]